MTLELYLQYNNKEYYMEIRSDSTVEELWEEVYNIIEVDDFELSFGEIVTSENNYYDLLSDLGISNRTKVHVIIIENKEADRIIEDYGKDPLFAYCEIFEIERSKVRYNHFENKYLGYFEDKYDLVHYILDTFEGFHIPAHDPINYENICQDFMLNFNRYNNHYFQKY